MRTLASACSAAALFGLAACNDPDCLENERKIGTVCHLIAGREDAATATEIGNVSAGDGGLPATSSMDGGTSSAADGSTGSATSSLDAETPPRMSEPNPDAQVTEPTTQNAAPADAGSAPVAALPCDGGAVNTCGGCEVLTHARDESCSNGGQGPCALPGTYQCLGTQLVCNAPPAMPSTEVCDGRDNDCNGKVDEGLVLNACGACGVPPSEVCDGRDNDCNGQIDDGVTTTWYPDCDGDGYAAIDGSVIGCTKPAFDGKCISYLSTAPVAGSTLDCRDDSSSYQPNSMWGSFEAQPGTGPWATTLRYDFNCDGLVQLSRYVGLANMPAPLPFCADENSTSCEAGPCVRGKTTRLSSLTNADCGHTLGEDAFLTFVMSGSTCTHPGTTAAIFCK